MAPPNSHQFVHTMRKRTRGVLSSGLSSPRFRKHHCMTTYVVSQASNGNASRLLSIQWLQGASHGDACNCDAPPIRNTTALVFAAVLEEKAFAANVPRPLDSTATSHCSLRRRFTSTFSCCFSQLLEVFIKNFRLDLARAERATPPPSSVSLLACTAHSAPRTTCEDWQQKTL